jgi:hypothetical protein
MAFQQILTESFNCQMLRKAVKSYSFIGYKNLVINYDGQKSVTVSLEEDANL